MIKRAPEPGDVVVSLAGRDAGRALVVLALADAEYALIADGETRKAEKAKRKKLKHLKATKTSFSSLRQKLEAGGAVENCELRACLSAYRQQEEG